MNGRMQLEYIELTWQVPEEVLVTSWLLFIPFCIQETKNSNSPCSSQRSIAQWSWTSAKKPPLQDRNEWSGSRIREKNLTPCSASCITPRHRWTALYSALSESSHPWICTGHEWWRIPASQKESVLNCSPYLRGSRGRESYELLYKECSLVPALASWKLGLEQFSISYICRNIDISYSILSAWCHPD